MAVKLEVEGQRCRHIFTTILSRLLINLIQLLLWVKLLDGIWRGGNVHWNLLLQSMEKARFLNECAIHKCPRVQEGCKAEMGV